MTDFFLSIKKKLSYVWLNVFWKHPSHLWALKVSLSIACFIIPVELFLHSSFYGTTLALGVVAMALSETDVHPKGNLKSLVLTLLLFFVTGSFVELLTPYPAYFAGMLSVVFFIYMLVGGISKQWQGIMFGNSLIFVYTMLGVGGSDMWFVQPLLYMIGALGYGIISNILLSLKPYRLLQTELASGFSYLSHYILTKSKLFPSESDTQNSIRNQLAQDNVDVAQQIEKCKSDLKNYLAESGGNNALVVENYLRQWLFLQDLHERAISSHEQYDVLSQQVSNVKLIEGFGQLMREIAYAIKLYADSILLNESYKHPISLSWTVSALKNMLRSEKGENHYSTLSLLMKNLSAIEWSLQHNAEVVRNLDISYFGTSKTETKSLKSLFKPSHPRFRFAVRLTVCLLLGYGLMQYFHFDKGAWILLTSIIVYQQTYSATRLRLVHRVSGTLAGVMLGIVLAQILPTLWGQIVLLLLSIYAFFYWLKINYTYAAVFITMFVLAAFNLQSNQGVAVMLPRIIDTLLGGTLAYLVVRYLWPDWQYKKLPVLLKTAVEKNKRYFESIYNAAIPEIDYQHNRRAAHNADNALTLAWKGMRLEPKRKRDFQQKAYILTYLNHTLLSYISAFGAHKSSLELTEEELTFCHYISSILQLTSESLSEGVPLAEVMKHTHEAEEWEEEINAAKESGNEGRHALVRNVARVSRDLLVEAYGIDGLYLS